MFDVFQSIRMVGWYMKFWMSYFRGYAKSYILMDDTYAVHPPGNEFKPVPVDSSLKDFWQVFFFLMPVGKV